MNVDVDTLRRAHYQHSCTASPWLASSASVIEPHLPASFKGAHLGMEIFGQTTAREGRGFVARDPMHQSSRRALQRRRSETKQYRGTAQQQRWAVNIPHESITLHLVVNKGGLGDPHPAACQRATAVHPPCAIQARWRELARFPSPTVLGECCTACRLSFLAAEISLGWQ